MKFREILLNNNYLISHNWSEYNFTTAVNSLNTLSKEKLEQLLSKAYYFGYFNRGWKNTMIKLYRRKGITLFLNFKRIFSTLRDFLGFFINIRKMKDKFS